MNGRITSAAAAAIALLPAMAFAQRATFEGIGHLPGGERTAAIAVSADGRVVVGRSGEFASAIAVRWAADTGLQQIASLPSTAWDVSADGSVIVVQQGGRGFRWTEALGLVDLGDVPGGSGRVSARAISDDGTVIVGDAEVGGGAMAYRWTEATGSELLFQDPPTHAWVTSISGDGTTIGGQFLSGPLWDQGFLWAGVGEPQPLGEGNIPGDISTDGSVAIGTQDCSVWYAFRWTGPGELELIAGAHSASGGVSADGSIVVGVDDDHFGDGPAFIWDDSRGPRHLRDVLIDEYGFDLTGWELRRATGVSADGTVIVGHGVNPAGQGEGWVARLGNGPCYADCDASGAIDFFDFLCYQDAFAAAEPWADCNDSGELDVFDFLCFQNAFAAGCD